MREEEVAPLLCLTASPAQRIGGVAGVMGGGAVAEHDANRRRPAHRLAAEAAAITIEDGDHIRLVGAEPS
jgi:hypothetical protein